MAIGKGKYDDALTKARELLGDDHAGVLIVIEPSGFVGFSCQATPLHMVNLPRMLRDIATAIEADVRSDAGAALRGSVPPTPPLNRAQRRQRD